MTIRPYDAEKDREAVARIWREVGWIEDEKEEKGLDVFLQCGRSLIGELNGEAECMANTDPGSMKYQDEEVPACCVTGVTTSRVARKQRLATSVTAEALRLAAEDGHAVAMLGIFDQGFYDRLGFGTGSYEHWYTFDPAQLKNVGSPRIPIRLTKDDWDEMHACRLRRHRSHGSVSILSPELTRSEAIWSTNGFGLGYRDRSGTLTHHVWCSTKDPEGGPYRIAWMACRTREEFLELLGLLRNLGDQVHSIRMHEPGGLQMQDLLHEPFKRERLTKASKHEHRVNAYAYLQARILDLHECISRTHLTTAGVAFNLVLTDPIEDHVSPGSGWRGIGGEYTIRFDEDSEASGGLTDGLPTLRASVGAFTRLWLGVLPATGLAWTDNLSAPEELLAALDRSLRLPAPANDWDF